MKISFHESLTSDANEIIDYYTMIAPRLGKAFRSEMMATIKTLPEMPERWPELENGVRQITLTQFPYLIYYRILSESHIRITSIKHQKRESNLNRERS